MGPKANALCKQHGDWKWNPDFNLTVSLKYQGVEKEFKKLLDQVSKLRKELLGLVDEDAEAYLEVIKSKGSEESIKEAAEVPLVTARKSLEVLKMASYASKEGNKNLRSDAHCAIELATAAIYGALENVRANLPFIEDEKLAGELRESIDQVLDGSGELVKP